MGYISDIARNQTHNLFRPKREPIPLGHSDNFSVKFASSIEISDKEPRRCTCEVRLLIEALLGSDQTTLPRGSLTAW